MRCGEELRFLRTLIASDTRFDDSSVAALDGTRMLRACELSGTLLSVSGVMRLLASHAELRVLGLLESYLRPSELVDLMVGGPVVVYGSCCSAQVLDDADDPLAVEDAGESFVRSVPDDATLAMQHRLTEILLQMKHVCTRDTASLGGGAAAEQAQVDMLRQYASSLCVALRMFGGVPSVVVSASALLGMLAEQRGSLAPADGGAASAQYSTSAAAFAVWTEQVLPALLGTLEAYPMGSSMARMALLGVLRVVRCVFGTGPDAVVRWLSWDTVRRTLLALSRLLGSSTRLPLMLQSVPDSVVDLVVAAMRAPRAERLVVRSSESIRPRGRRRRSLRVRVCVCASCCRRLLCQ